ncbi:MAG: hypothetical protein NT007_02425 [Candidatus Kapabacteria bacterium]|nr:hypothetical protein [Candidatus Kapabacteria bacterium]
MDVGSSKSNISTDLVNKIIFDSGTIETGSTAPNLATKADSFSQLLQTETAQTNKISLVQLLVFQKVNKENLSISSDLVNPAAQSEASSSVKSENIVDEPTNNLTEIIVQKDIQLPVNSKNELNQNLINKLFFSEKFVNNNNIQGIPDSFKIGNLVNLDSVYLNFNSENIANVNELNAAIEALVNSKSSQKEPLEGLGKIINQIEKNVIGSKNSSNKFDLAKLIASFEALSGQAETVSDPDVKENNEKAKYINSGKTDQSDALKLVPDALVAITENTNGIKAFKTEISNSDNDQLISLTTISQSTKPAAKAIEGISAKVYPENIKAITDKPTKEPITEDLPKMAAGAEQKVSIEVKFVENQTVTEKPATGRQQNQ